MATIETRKGKKGTRYRALIRRKNARPLSKTFTRKTDAAKWALQQEAAIERGEPIAGKGTVHSIIERYRKEVLPSRRKTDQANFAHMLNFWDEQIGHLSLEAFRSSHISEGRSTLETSQNKYGRPFAPSTVSNYMIAISVVCQKAVTDWQLLPTNPAKGISRPSLPPGRDRFLSPDGERDRLLAACRAVNDRLYFLVVMALTTGGRRGELLKLRWSEVDLGRQTVTFKKTKNGKDRCAALAGEALILMQDAARRKDRTDGLVFTKTSFPREQWMKALAMAGIEDFHFHDLRHTFASYMAMSGASLRELADALGHLTLNMVMRYAHLTEQHTRKVVIKMAGAYLPGQVRQTRDCARSRHPQRRKTARTMASTRRRTRQTSDAVSIVH